MNDTELDQLLDTWRAPAPPRSLREGLRARLPQGEKRRLPWRWVLALAAVSALLALGVAQNAGSSWNYRLVRVWSGLSQWYEDFLVGLETRQASTIVAQIRQSNPQVYVDGQLAPPLEYGPAARMDVQVPGDGVYSIVVYSIVSGRGGWAEAGRMHGSVIEFQVGGRQVRIECSRPIVDSERPVFVRRRP